MENRQQQHGSINNGQAVLAPDTVEVRLQSTGDAFGDCHQGAWGQWLNSAGPQACCGTEEAEPEWRGGSACKLHAPQHEQLQRLPCISGH